MKEIKIIITDDHELFRRGVKTALSGKERISIIGEAENGKDLLQKLEYLNPDIVLLDIQMPVMDGLTVLPILREKYPKLKVIVISMHNDSSVVCKMIELGANSYLTTESGSNEIYEAILACDKNWFFISDIIAGSLIKSKSKVSTPNEPYKYSNKEVSILKLLKRGKKINTISSEVDLSPRTVQAIIEKLKAKTETQSIKDLILFVSKRHPEILRKRTLYHILKLKRIITWKEIFLSALYFLIAVALLLIVDIGLAWLFNEVVFDILDSFNKLHLFFKLLILFLGGATLFWALLAIVSRISTLIGGLIFDRLPKNWFTVIAPFVVAIANAIWNLVLLWSLPTHFNFWIIVELIFLSVFIWGLSAIVLPAKEQIKSFKNEDRY